MFPYQFHTNSLELHRLIRPYCTLTWLHSIDFTMIYTLNRKTWHFSTNVFLCVWKIQSLSIKGPKEEKLQITINDYDIIYWPIINPQGVIKYKEHLWDIYKGHACIITKFCLHSTLQIDCGWRGANNIKENKTWLGVVQYMHHCYGNRVDHKTAKDTRGQWFKSLYIVFDRILYPVQDCDQLYWL